MSFNTTQFLKEEFSPRTEDVKVPGLKTWFDEGEDPVFTVRALTGHELANADAASKKMQTGGKLLESFMTGSTEEKIESIKQQLGLSTEVPAESAKRMEMLVIATVEPKLTMEVASSMVLNFPIEFYMVTNTISKITGMGAVSEAKPISSGQTQG